VLVIGATKEMELYVWTLMNATQAHATVMPPVPTLRDHTHVLVTQDTRVMERPAQILMNARSTALATPRLPALTPLDRLSVPVIQVGQVTALPARTSMSVQNTHRAMHMRHVLTAPEVTHVLVIGATKEMEHTAKYRIQ
jgi:hypothetical protein